VITFFSKNVSVLLKGIAVARFLEQIDVSSKDSLTTTPDNKKNKEN